VRHLLVIGIGPGNPEQVTVEAVEAMRSADVFFVVDKGAGKQDLLDARREICARYVTDRPRVVEVRDPERDRTADGYRAAVEAWDEARAEAYEQVVAAELGEDGRGAFLVWGDPSLYDGTLRVLARMAARGNVAFECSVVPGITSVQALAARHRIALTGIGEPVQITTGRRLAAEGFPAGVDSVVVMLDGGTSFEQVAADGIDIYWGAYLGTDDELLAAGPLPASASAIADTRRDARERRGWIMDTYLLRRRDAGADGE
jgi:precorrin-6A synthase